MSATGAGALLGAVYLASRRSIIGLGKIIPITAGIFGMGLIGFSLSRILWLSLLLMFIAGFGVMVQVASSNTLLQTIVDDNMRGRVMSFFAVSFMGMAPFGSLLAGSLAGMMGVANTLMMGGICCVIGATVYARKGYAFLGPPHKSF
jgi:MFS family permease